MATKQPCDRAMLAERPVLVIAFPGGRGTADAVAAAERRFLTSEGDGDA